MARCPFGTECFAERAKGAAARADVVVTNHALLAINAVADSAVLPEHQLLVVDEAHDLVDRVTAVATGELSATALGVASRRTARLIEPELMQRWERASANFTAAIQDASAGRIDHLDDELTTHLAALRNAHPGVFRAGDPGPHRRGLAGPRGQPRVDAKCAAGGAVVGVRTAAYPIVRRLDGGVDLGDLDRRRLVRRDGQGVGPR
jgi:ATP-dependent DNA helicase DinG